MFVLFCVACICGVCQLGLEYWFVWLWLYFFFFKQKTAYELRISDWSSDVCSSDLIAPQRAGNKRGIVEGIFRVAHQIEISVGAPAAKRRFLVCQQDVVGTAGKTDGGDRSRRDVVDEDFSPRGKIGRASCRERVCQYV